MSPVSHGRGVITARMTSVSRETGVIECARSAAVLAAALSLAHSVATSRAAPIMLSLRHAEGDDPGTGDRLDRFERWQTARVLGQLVTLAAALAAAIPSRGR